MSDVRTDRVLLLLRQRVPELDFDDLNVTQTGFEKWSFTDRKSGVEYRRADYEPSLGPVPPDVVAFTVDAGGRLHFLRQRRAAA